MTTRISNSYTHWTKKSFRCFLLSFKIIQRINVIINFRANLGWKGHRRFTFPVHLIISKRSCKPLFVKKRESVLVQSKIYMALELILDYIYKSTICNKICSRTQVARNKVVFNGNFCIYIILLCVFEEQKIRTIKYVKSIVWSCYLESLYRTFSVNY